MVDGGGVDVFLGESVMAMAMVMVMVMVTSLAKDEDGGDNI